MIEDDAATRALPYEDMREARRQILAVTDPQAQAALFTLLGLLHNLSQALEESHS